MNPLEQLMQQPQQGAPPVAMSQPQQTPPAMPPQPQGGNPLAQLVPQQQPQQSMPAPNKAQTVAAVHRFSAIRAAMAPIMEDPKFGMDNVRPKILDAGSKLLANKILTLPELMNSIKDIPDDPQAQRKFVEGVFNQAGQARASVLEHHAAAEQQEDEQAEQWSPDNHANMIQGLMGHYKNA